MNRIRITYTKAKEAAFISNIDFIKIIEHACVRARLELEYDRDNEPYITIANPLPMGVESVAETCDIGIKELMDSSTLVKYLNKELPAGVIVLSAEILNENERDVNEGIYASVYEILPEFKNTEHMSKKEYENLRNWYKDLLVEFMEQSEIKVLVKSKDRSERIDIKPQIYEYSIQINDALHVTVASSQTNMLNPSYIMDGFNEYIDRKLTYSIRRIKILCK